MYRKGVFCTKTNSCTKSLCYNPIRPTAFLREHDGSQQQPQQQQQNVSTDSQQQQPQQQQNVFTDPQQQQQQPQQQSPSYLASNEMNQFLQVSGEIEEMIDVFRDQITNPCRFQIWKDIEI
ncbi:hypothetical protein CEXT_662211 [Caerostris extrusa]|uniref:Uncharacterized protein n=1 Tax=Caerostris extrusa TaxID=172846 RepID=A0AAV4WQT9_CAEEX|nr:hypothetical protein CEXT_662211 [Caerostris extrusa]